MPGVRSPLNLRCMQVASKLGLGSGGLGRLKRRTAPRPSGDPQQSLDELQASPRGLLQTLSTAQPRDEILGGELVVQVVEAQVASECLCVTAPEHCSSLHPVPIVRQPAERCTCATTTRANAVHSHHLQSAAAVMLHGLAVLQRPAPQHPPLHFSCQVRHRPAKPSLVSSHHQAQMSATRAAISAPPSRYPPECMHTSR